MILVIKNGKVFAIHTDEQEYVVNNYAADCDVIKVPDDAVEFPRDAAGRPVGMPEDPRPKGVSYIDLRKQGTSEEVLANYLVDLDYRISLIELGLTEV